MSRCESVVFVVVENEYHGIVTPYSVYEVIDTFVLPEQSWWDNYYGWIEKKLPKLKEINKNDQEALQHIASEEKEIDMFRKYSKYYGYAFYIMQKQDFK